MIRLIVDGFAAIDASRAHYSYADFVQCESVSLRGEIVSLQWVNPHVLLSAASATGRARRCGLSAALSFWV